MHRFILPPDAIATGRPLLDKKESHHAKNVLRVKEGEVVELLDGKGGAFRAVVAGFEDGRVALTVDKRKEGKSSSVEISLSCAVIKPERMEWMLEKACELGVTAWAPVLAARGVVKLSKERWEAKTGRWTKIAAASCKQCGLARVPEVKSPVPFKEAAERIKEHDLALFPTLERAGKDLHEVLEKHGSAKKVIVFIGPEGDWTPEETDRALAAGAVPVSLGSLVLRAETAGLYTVSALRYFYDSATNPRNISN
jgi:16S rRNA (uracil1498-N3)-methyltransferase